MKKKDFKKMIFESLSNEFKVIIYFNGKLAKKHRVAISNKYLGMAYTHLKIKKIVITWQKDHYGTLQTLFHEIGHITLHSRGSYFRGSSAIQEIEAEMVAREACDLLKLPYDPNFKISKKNYIESHYKDIKKNEEPRIEKINDCANRIYKVLKDKF